MSENLKSAQELLNEGLEEERIKHENMVRGLLLKKHKEVEAARKVWEKLDQEYKDLLRKPVADIEVPIYDKFTVDFGMAQELGRATRDLHFDSTRYIKA